MGGIKSLLIRGTLKRQPLTSKCMNKKHLIPLVYAAGIVDGEGSICILRQQNKREVGQDWYYILRLCVKMCDGKVIDYLHGNFGGTVCFREKEVGQNYCQYDWHVGGKRAVEVLKKMLPFLVGKKEQAELAIRFQSGRAQGKKVNHDFDAMCQNKMKELHKFHHTCAVVETKRSEGNQPKR